MLKFEAILLDPSPGEIAERLADATAAANKRCRTRLLADDPAKWRKFARQVQASPEGFELWRGGKGGVPGTQLVGGWWTDHVGRKHVVLRGRRIEHDAAKVLLHKDELARRPPLWHCYPEHLYQRLLPDGDGVPVTEWIAACGCGAVGTPEALGWMGETCGPCHDRREEAGPAALKGNRVGWLHGVRNPFSCVAFSRDGTKVAAVEEDGPLCAWDLETGGTRPGRTSPFEIREGRAFFLGDRDDRVLVTEQITGWTCVFKALKGSDDGRWEPGGLTEDFRTFPTDEPDRVAVLFGNTLRVAAYPSGKTLHAREFPGAVWVSSPTRPDPRHVVAVGTEQVTVLESATLGETATVPLRLMLPSGAHVYHNIQAVYHEAMNVVFIGRHSDLEIFDARTANYRPSISLYRVPIASYQNGPAFVRAMALSPDGRFLYLAVAGRLVVFSAGLMQPKAAFAWHVGDIEALAVSPDGKTVATIGNDGVVKLWPMDRLLDV
jgi:DNA-binding beta-propeller fold protein YncE